MSPEVCEIVSAQKSIWAGEGDGRWATEQPKASMFPTSFAGSNRRLFPRFLNR